MEDIITYPQAGSTSDRAPGHPATDALVIASIHSKWRGVGDMQASTPPHTKHIASDNNIRILPARTQTRTQAASTSLSARG